MKNKLFTNPLAYMIAGISLFLLANVFIPLSGYFSMGLIVFGLTMFVADNEKSVISFIKGIYWQIYGLVAVLIFMIGLLVFIHPKPLPEKTSVPLIFVSQKVLEPVKSFEFKNGNTYVTVGDAVYILNGEHSMSTGVKPTFEIWNDNGVNKPALFIEGWPVPYYINQ